MIGSSCEKKGVLSKWMLRISGSFDASDLWFLSSTNVLTNGKIEGMLYMGMDGRDLIGIL